MLTIMKYLVLLLQIPLIIFSPDAADLVQNAADLLAPEDQSKVISPHTSNLWNFCHFQNDTSTTLNQNYSVTHYMLSRFSFLPNFIWFQKYKDSFLKTPLWPSFKHHNSFCVCSLLNTKSSACIEEHVERKRTTEVLFERTLINLN